MLSPVLKKSLATAAAGAVALTATALPTQTAYAEEQQQQTNNPKKKLSIYDEPKPQIVVVEAPTKLEEHMAYAEKLANEKLDQGRAHVQNVYDEYKRVENCVTNTIKETIDKDEEILPNGLYVGVAALAGTIIARNRNIIIRFATSTALAVGTAHYLLPKTTHNVFAQLEKLERRYPELQSAHKSVNDAVSDVQKQVEDTLAQLRGSFDESTSKLLGQIQGNKDAAAQEAKDNFENVKKNVESMYSTRSNPGVEETLKKSNNNNN